MSEGGKRKLEEGETQGKKVKIDENDIDFLIGDLFKEEAQLVLTRLLRLEGLEEHIRRHIEMIRSGRNKISEDQLKKQFNQIQQLRALQEQAFSFHPGAGMSGLGGVGGMGPMGSGSVTLDPSILRSIKTKIRDSFKKSQTRKGEYYRVDETAVQNELNNAKEKSMKGSIRLPLEILQAITEEFLERSSQINEENVENHSNVLEMIGKTWIEVFLNESVDNTSELTDDERENWSEKLRSWNKSPEEESVLNAARWGARYGWQDSTLKKLMAGEISNDPNTPDSPVFKEPPRLTQERLSVLERNKLFNEGLNLSKGLLLHFQAARFLVKLNRAQEAQEAAMKLTNATEISAIAQTARPVDVDVAFTLAIHSISVQDTTKVTEMSNWLTDLAISEKRLEKLVEQVSKMVKNKNTQFRIIKLLKSKDQVKTALQLAQNTIKPYTQDELISLWHPTPLNAKPEDLLLTPNTRKQLIASIPGAEVPQDLGQFIWETAYESDNNKSITLDTNTSIGSNNNNSKFQDEILPVLLNYMNDASQIISLMTTIDSIGKHSCVQTILQLGKSALDKIIEQEKFDQEFKREAAIEKYNYDRDKEIADSLGKITPPLAQKPVDHPQYDFESSRLQVCRTMLSSVFNAKKYYEDLVEQQQQQQQSISSTSTSTTTTTTTTTSAATGSTTTTTTINKLSEEERLSKIQEYEKTLETLVEISITKISNPNNLLIIANDVCGRQEYRLALTMSQRAFSQIQLLDKERKVRDEWVSQYKQLESEQKILLNQHLALDNDKLEKFKKLSLDYALLSLQPSYLKSANEQSIQNLYQQIANFNVETALKSKSSLILERRLKTEEIFDIIEKSLTFVESPQGLSNLVRVSQNWNEYTLVQKIGKHALIVISSLKDKLIHRSTINKEIEILQYESQNLINCKKELDTPQKSRLEELNNQVKNVLPPTQFYELRSSDEYDNLSNSIIQDMITSAINEKNNLESQISSLSHFQNSSSSSSSSSTTSSTNDENALKEKEKNLKNSLEEAIKRLESIFNECLPQLHNPDNILALSQTLSRNQQIEFSIKAAEYCQIQCKKLIESRKTIWEEEQDLNELIKELNELLAQKPSQYLPQDKSDQYRQLQLQSSIRSIDSAYKRKNIIHFNNIIQQCAIQMISTLSNKERETITQIDHLVNEIINPPPPSNFGNSLLVNQEAIEAAQKAAINSKKLKKIQLEKELPKYSNEKRRLISQSLQTLSFDDNSLIQIIQQITLTDIESVELLTKSIPTVFDLIQLHDQERIKFSENNEKVQLLQEESNLLEKYRKKLSDEKAKELATLLRDIARWNFFGTRPSSDQFATFIHNLSNNSLTSLVQAKNQVDNTIKKIEDNEKLLNLDKELLYPGNDLNYLKNFSSTIYNHIETFINLLLNKVENPHALFSVAIIIRSFLPLLYKVLRKSLDLTKKVDMIYDERAIVLEELEKLEEEATHLADVNKQLKKEQQDRLVELRHQKFVWFQEPAFTRNTPEARDKLKYDILHSAESSIVYQRNILQSKLKVLEDEKLTLLANADNQSGGGGDAMQVDGAPKVRTLVDVNKEIDETKVEIQKLRDELARVIKEFVKDLTDPQHLLDVTNNLLSNSEHELLQEVARQGIELTLKLDSERQKQLEGFKKYYFLLQELYEKKRNNNLLHPTRATLLKNVQDEITQYLPIRYGLRKSGGTGKNKATYHYPTKEDLDFCSSLAESKDIKFNEEPRDLSLSLHSNTLSSIASQIGQIMVNSVLTSISEFEAELTEMVQKGIKDPEKEESPEIIQKRKTLQVKLLDTCYYVFDKIQDFTSNNSVFDTIRDEEQYQALYPIAKRICQQIKPLRSSSIDNNLLVLEMRKLEQQQQQLASVRSSLSEQEELRLIELQFEQKLRTILPTYLTMNKQQYDNNTFKVLNSLVSVTYDKKNEVENKFNEMINAPRLVRGVSMSEDQIKEKSKVEVGSLEKDIDSALDLCIEFIVELQHFVGLVVKANGEYRDFVRVIRLGTRAQEMLKEQLEIQEKYDSLTKLKLELEEKQISGAPPSDELVDVRNQLEELEPKLNHSTNQLRHWILEVAGFMIDAARIEKKDHIVLEQAILVFKMTMTHDKFEEVRNLTDPKDWDKVRKDLLNYVAKHDTTLPGSPITLKTQIELLLRESLCSEAIDIFPDPGSDLYDNTSRIEILELLWFEVDRQKPAMLDRILPIIEKYAKKEFQQFKITTLDRLFDFVQNKFPDFIVVIYSRGSEILLGNMTATKYNVYTQFLRTLKKRLTVDIQRPKDWDDFIAKIKKENSRKKKLLQMINIDEI